MERINPLPSVATFAEYPFNTIKQNVYLYGHLCAAGNRESRTKCGTAAGVKARATSFLVLLCHEAKMFACKGIFTKPSIAQAARSAERRQPQKLAQHAFLRVLYHE